MSFPAWLARQARVLARFCSRHKLDPVRAVLEFRFGERYREKHGKELSLAQNPTTSPD